MSVREPFSWVEIDVDGCALTFGVGPCTAALGVGGVVRKCYETRATCRKPAVFQHLPVWRTLRYCQPRSNLPKGETFYPVMVGDPSEFSASVNIAGSDSDLSAFGRRATIKVSLLDFPDHDRYLDPYQAQRLSGAAQIDEPGFDPRSRGTHFARLKTRWPFYAGRALRRCDGYLVGGTIADITVRHYFITNVTGPDVNGEVVIEASDAVDFADDKRVVAPQPSHGALLADVGADLTPFTLTPSGIGDAEYPASGRARIGSEFIDYTRVGDVVTPAARAVSRTASSTHRAGDTFQVVLSYVNARVDDVLADLFLQAGVPIGLLPTADWLAEVDRWLSGIRLTRDIGAPTGIKSLISSMVPLGFSVWWDSSTPQVKLKANRPVDGDTIRDLSDESTNLAVNLETVDKRRVSEVLFWTVQKTPAGSASATDNYSRMWAATDLSAREVFSYRTGQVKSYVCPWLNTGADSIVRVAAGRLLRRMSTAPVIATVELDAKWAGIQLTDVVRLRTGGLQNDTGKTETALFEVIQRSEPKAGERIKIALQSYQFAGRFSYAAQNDAPSYLLAAVNVRDPGMFACDPITLQMPNGDPPYEAI